MWLQDPGPDLVVADEAHEIKNTKSQIGNVLSFIKTGSRVATTGSPLSNHLKEYWAMMNWIHPGFLGSLGGFTGEYIAPIKDGLYADSTREERKTSQKRLVMLKRLLDDKIHRLDLTAIQSDLPPKTEFVVYVPLTPLQRKLYDALIKESKWDENNRLCLFKWINILRLICNHPITLKVTSPNL
jgi:SNF2 family DNA or RNA helicase